MAQLAESGTYEVSEALKGKLFKSFAAGYCGDARTKEVIGAMWREKHYLIDPHTAVAFDVLDQYRKETGDSTPAVVVSTASPFKFCDSVLNAIGVTDLAQGTGLIDQLAETTGIAAPVPLAELKGREIRFNWSVTKEHMVDQVLNMLN